MGRRPAVTNDARIVVQRMTNSRSEMGLIAIKRIAHSISRFQAEKRSQQASQYCTHPTHTISVQEKQDAGCGSMGRLDKRGARCKRATPCHFQSARPSARKAKPPESITCSRVSAAPEVVPAFHILP